MLGSESVARVFVINLDEDLQRLQRFDAQLRQHRVPFRRWRLPRERSSMDANLASSR